MHFFLYLADYLLYEVFYYFYIAAVMVFLHCFYDPGFQWHKKKALWLLGSMLVDTLLILIDYQLFRYETIPVWAAILALTVTVGMMVMRIVLILYDYRGKRIWGFLKFLWVYLLVAVCLSLITDIASRYVFHDYDPDSVILTSSQSISASVVMSVFFMGVFFYMYFRLYKQGITFPWTKRERIFIAVYALVCAALTFIIDYFGKDGNVSLAIMGGAFVLMATLVPVFFYYLRVSEHFQNRTKSQEVYMQEQLAYFRQYKQTQEETRRFRHDIKNDLLCISELLRSGKTDEAAQFLNNLLEVTQSLGTRFVTGDEILDSIVAAKSAVMEQSRITFHLDGVIAGALAWKSVDVCSVFANALDNSIEANQALSEDIRYIDMKVKSTPQFWFICIENPVKEDVDTAKLFKKRGGYTTKADTSRHGIGTYSIKQTVERYGGMVTAKCADKRFTLEFMIPR